MSLCPRYSLLTLLVLTALVAGGAKLWRGPHRAVLHDPPTSAELPFLNAYSNVGFRDFFIQHGVPIQYEVETMREWEGERVLSLKGIPPQEIMFPNIELTAADPCKVLLTPALLAELDAEQKQKVDQGESEHIVCLLHRGREPRPLPVEAMSPSDAPPLNVPGKRPRPQNRPEYQPNPLYALTDRKQIYELECVHAIYALAGKLVTLDQVLDEDLRAKITTELANIPDPPPAR